MKIARVTAISILCLGMSIVCHTADANEINQWVKTGELPSGEGLELHGDTTGLLSSCTSCNGANCTVCRLSTTPFSQNGSIDYWVLYGKAGCASNQISIPFSVNNDSLTTPPQTYLVTWQSGSNRDCPKYSIIADVTGDPSAGYTINFIKN